MNRDRFLKSQKILRLGTIDSKGRPHLIPVWYMYKDGLYYIGTNTRTQKIRDIMRNPKVGFCVDRGVHTPIYGVMGKGIARLILNKKEVSRLAKSILLKYFKNLKNRSAQELLDQTDCIIKIQPKKITEWSY